MPCNNVSDILPYIHILSYLIASFSVFTTHVAVTPSFVEWQARARVGSTRICVMPDVGFT